MSTEGGVLQCRWCGLEVEGFDKALDYEHPCVRTPGLKHSWQENRGDDGRGDSPWLMFAHLEVGERFIVTDWSIRHWLRGAVLEKTSDARTMSANALVVAGPGEGKTRITSLETEVLRVPVRAGQWVQTTRDIPDLGNGGTLIEAGVRLQVVSNESFGEVWVEHEDVMLLTPDEYRVVGLVRT